MNFDRFLGQKVLVNVETQTMDIGGEPYTFENCDIAPEDTVVQELTQEIEKTGSKVRVWLPGMMGTMDWVPSRVNIYISKQDDGSFAIDRIANG